MTPLAWLRSIRHRPLAVRPIRVRRIRPLLEALEDRTVPSTVTWVGGSGDWDNPANWSSGALPGVNDNAVINTTGAITVTHTGSAAESVKSLTTGSNDTLNWTNGTLTLGSASTLAGTSDLSGGTWTGPGSLSITGTLNWNNDGVMNALNGQGTITLASGATLNLGGNNNYEVLDARTFLNDGTVNWLAGSTNYFYLQNGAIFNNQSSGVFNDSNNQNLETSVGNFGTFKNAGTFNEAPSSGASNFFSVVFNNSGTVNVTSGTLILNNGGSDSGTFNVAASSILQFNGGVDNATAATTNGAGEILVSAGYVTFGSGYGLSGTSVFTGGNVHFGQTATIANLTLSGGEISGSGNVTVTGTLTWTNNGIMTGTGTTTLASGATLNLGGNNDYEDLDGRTFKNAGTVNWLAASTNYFYLQNGSIFNNESTGIFNDNNNQLIDTSTGTFGTFKNAGTFNEAPASGTSVVSNVQFNNSGTVNVNTGTLILDSGGTDIGTYNVAAGAVLQFNGGIDNLNAATISGAGEVLVTAGTADFGSGYGLTGTTVFAGGVSHFGQATSIANLNLSGGTLSGSGNVTITGTLNWNNTGIMTGPGITTLASTATLNLGGDSTYQVLDGRTFNNYGHTNWLAASTNYFYLQDGAVFNNESAAVFTDDNNQNLETSAGANGAFNNIGTFAEAPASGATNVVGVLFNNSGTVNVTSGTLILNSGGTDSKGTFLVASGAAVDFNGGITTLVSNFGTSSNFQHGNLLFTAGTSTLTDVCNITTTINTGAVVYFNKAVSIPNLTLGNATMEGTAAVTITKQLTWNNDGLMTGSGSTKLGSAATLNLGGNGNYEVLDGRTFFNAGHVNWLAASTNYFYLQDGAIFNNQATGVFTDNNNQNLETSVGVEGTFLNAGTFTEAPTSGVSNIVSVQFNNSGTVNVNTGTLILNSGGNDSKGAFNVKSGATLEFNGGYTTLASNFGTATLMQPGTLLFGGGTTTVSGICNIATTINYAGSSAVVVVFDKAISIPILNLGDGTLTGTAAVTITGTLNWNNVGLMSGTGSTTLAAGATLNLGGDNTSQELDGRTFNNAGTAKWLAGSVNYFYLQDGAVFNNESGATFTDSNNQTLDSTAGANGVFNNAGTFTLAPTSGASNVSGVIFNNSGTVNVNSGTLVLNSGGDDSAGAFNVASGATLDFAGGVTTLDSNIGTATQTQPGNLLLSGGTTTVAGFCNIATTINNGAAGTFDENVSIPILNLGNGFLSGTGNVTVTGTLTWNNYGDMNDLGTTTLAAGATLNLGGDSSYQLVDGRTFNNFGTVNWLAGSTNTFYLQNGATFNNESGAVFNDANTQTIYTGSGANGIFNNAGTFTEAPPSGTSNITNVVFNNSGTVNVNVGTLAVNSGGIDSGKFAVASGATLAFGGGIDNLSAASIAGAGNVSISAGNLGIGAYSIGGATSISGGTVRFVNGGGTGTFSNSGGDLGFASGTTFTIASGNYSQTGGFTYLNGGTLAVSSGNAVSIASGTLFYGPGTIDGNLTNDGSLFVGGGGLATGPLTVNGNFTQTSNGATVFNIGGATAGTQFDQLNISGSASFTATLDINLINGYNPPANTTFDIMTYGSESGDFTSKNLPGGWTAAPGGTDYVATA